MMREDTYRHHSFTEYTDLEDAIDPSHADMSIFSQEITQHIWEEKYKHPSDGNHPHQTFQRICKGIYNLEENVIHEKMALSAMRAGLWLPGGRINAGAGTDKHVTLINCYVDRTIEDSMIGIKDALGDAMLTMQQGGGIGMDFSPLRPKGALLKRTGSDASGPLPFMDMWNAMCSTIKSAGSRRGAMMATMCDDHPDLPEFINAKHTQGRLTNFNMSILITDAFMDAVNANEKWYLGHTEPPIDNSHLFVVESDGNPDWYVYSEWKARDLWDMIMRSTYEYSEPGVVFIDRVNDTNNLKYTEHISCTNPCGEQPLPPNGACNLGAVNLARMVKDPFTSNSMFNFELLQRTATIGTRFLDNVIDVTYYPLDTQAAEEISKRRIGVGITGLANALAELRIVYGSEEALQTTHRIMECLKNSVYAASASLAKEKGSFPLYDNEQWGLHSPVVASLPEGIRDDIAEHGIRNGVLLTIAPVGTGSMFYGNVSSGVEPVFFWEAKRKVLQPNGSYKHFSAMDYGYNLYKKLQRQEASVQLPTYMKTFEDLSVNDHVRMQAVCQKHIDASISKTINCPENITFEALKLVYWDAYTTGCKGCTTYRPSKVRGSVVEDAAATTPKTTTPEAKSRARPEKLSGDTYKIKWPSIDAAFYITINSMSAEDDTQQIPYEIFISSTSSKYSEWTTALTLMISAIMQTGYDATFIPTELKKVVSATDTAWIGGKHYSSLVALIGYTIEAHFESIGLIDRRAESKKGVIAKRTSDEDDSPMLLTKGTYERCPKCDSLAMLPISGCMVCQECGFSKCD